MRPWLVRLHRWLSWTLALPLLGLIGTGLVLSVEPILARLQRPEAPIPAAVVEAALRVADPAGRARALGLDAAHGVLSLGRARFELASGAPLAGQGESVFRFSRRLHETLLLGDGWLVTVATAGLVVILLLGLFMGPPKRLRNSLLGWHRGLGWVLAPLLVLSPVTGLLLALRLGSAPPPAGERPAPLPLVEAVRVVAQARGDDLRDLVWLRGIGGRQLARLWEGEELRVYAVTPGGLVAQPRAWARVLHEGNWAGIWSGLVNLVTSLALLALLVTGPLLWWRGWRRRAAVRARPALPQGAGAE